MSDYTPTTSEVRTHWGIAVDYHRREERLAEFDRMIAEVERAAAEKAWKEGAEAAFYNPEIRGLVDYPDDNPYRAAALGLNEGGSNA